MESQQNNDIDNQLLSTSSTIFDIQKESMTVPLHLRTWLTSEQVTLMYPLSKSMLQKHKQYSLPAKIIHGKVLFKKEDIETKIILSVPYHLAFELIP